MRIHFKSRQLLETNDNKNFASRGLLADNALAMDAVMNNEASVLVSFIKGVDTRPRPMSISEIQELGDVFTQKLLLKSLNPLTLKELITAIGALENEDSLPLRKMFLVAEGGQHHLNNPSFSMNSRLVFTWQKNSSHSPDLLLSTVPVANNPDSLLQLISWSSKDGAFHFFERRNGIWAWAGNSFHALSPPSRGQGPFDSHINGGLVMKELKFPWSHWHSQSSTISRANFENNSEFNTDTLFRVISGAEELEAIVKTGVRKWTQSRIKTDIKSGTFSNVPSYLRQIVAPTSVNLASSSIEFHRVEKLPLALPSTFFFDLDGLELAIMTIDPFSNAIPAGRLEVNGSLYKEAALNLNMNITSEEGILLKRDTHFCFVIPERAFEDLEVSRQLVEKEIISAQMLLCLLMVDFPNPVESKRRASLLRYCPESVSFENGKSNFDEKWVENIQNVNPASGSPEQEFLSYWNDPDIIQRAEKELHTFFQNVQQNLRTPEYIENLIKLADYRKDFFRKRRFDDLDEFSATTSQIMNVEGVWEMNKTGDIIKS